MKPQGETLQRQTDLAWSKKYNLWWKLEFFWNQWFWPQERHIRTCQYFDSVENKLDEYN
jgi:hypothetical protein